MDKPLEYEFAKDGDRNTNLPNANADDNSVSFQSGFTLPYELNPANGGKNIERSDMNEIFYRICKAINDTAEQVGIWNALTTENLNDIKQRGYYYQNANIQATNERNYPINTAGYLIVFNNSINSWGVTQFYKVYNSDRVYIRRTTSVTGWSEWDSFILSSEYNAKVTQLQNSINTKEDKTKITLQGSNDANWNNRKTQGWYYANATGTNKPNNNAMWGVVIDRGNDTYYQELHEFSNGKIWSRQFASGAWSAWDSLMLTSEANTTYRKIADSYTKTETNTQINNAVNSTTHRYKALRCNPSANTIQWQTGGISISKQNDYTVRITHNLGTTNYAVTASINRIGRPLGASSANVVAINAKYCDISCHWGGDNAQGNILPTIMNVSIFY